MSIIKLYLEVGLCWSIFAAIRHWQIKGQNGMFHAWWMNVLAWPLCIVLAWFHDRKDSQVPSWVKSLRKWCLLTFNGKA